MYHYSLRTDLIVDEEGKEHTVYGLDVTSETGFLLKSIPDIFTSPRQMEKLIEVLNAAQPHLIHLRDIVEDAVCMGDFLPF